MNRLAASMLRNSAAASCLPVTAAQASAVSSSRTEVSSMKPATSGGCCSRTSQMKYSAIVWLRTSSARAIWAGSLLARSVSAAICSAATHPSLRPCKSASSPGATRTPKFSSRAPLSDSERYRSLLRSSHSSPDSRSRCSRTGGSARPASTSCAVLAGQRSTRSVMVLAAAAAAWKSSTTITDPAGSLAASFAIEAVTSADITPSIASSSAASAPNPGATARGAWMNPVQKRTGSASASSHESQDVTPPCRVAAQLDKSTLLPAPADPTTTVRRWLAPASSRPSSVGLVSSVVGSVVGRNFASANRASCGTRSVTARCAPASSRSSKFIHAPGE